MRKAISSTRLGQCKSVSSHLYPAEADLMAGK